MIVGIEGQSVDVMYKPKEPIEYAIKKALEIETQKTESNKTMQRVYALCLDKKGRVVSESRNYYDKTHPLQYKFASIVGNKEATCLHAEIGAITRAKNKEIYKIVVARVGNSGKTLPASPCPICKEAIKSHGIKVIEHTI